MPAVYSPILPRLALVLGFLGIGSALRADWPHVRGPQYDGVSAETALADVWPADGPPRLWSRHLGQGYSGFVLANDKLYTQTQSLGGQYLLCLDPDSGQTIWEFRYDWAWQPKGAYPGPYASPTFYRGKIFYASTTGKVGCVDADTGAERWSLSVKERFQGKGWSFGYAATPLVEDDKVILPVGGPGASLVALHVEDGRTVWQTGNDPASYCPAMPITFRGRRCVVGYLQNAMILVDRSSGALLHRQALSGGYDEHSAWPIYQEPYLLLAGPFRVPAARYELQPAANGAIACRLEWMSKAMCNDVVSSVFYKDCLYGFDLKQLQSSPQRASHGAFKCIDWATGKVRWATEEVGHAAPLVADGKLYLLSDTGTLILARADPASYQELARTQLFTDEICWTPPLLWHGRLFVRSPSAAVCVYVGHPDRTQPPATISGNLVRAWRIDPGWLLSRERDYPNDAPTWEEMFVWFGVCLVVLGTAAVGAVGISSAVKRLPAAPIFFGIAFALGLLGPNVFSALADRCLFTWPVSLYIAFQAALSAYARTACAAGTRDRWRARLAGALFLLVVYLYFEACKTIGMYIFWSFLFGFPAAFPFAFLAARAHRNAQPPWRGAACTILAFGVFFWSCQGLFLWKTAQAD